MARVVKESHSFACAPTRFSANGMNPAFACPADAGPHFADPGSTEDLVDLWSILWVAERVAKPRQNTTDYTVECTAVM